MPSARRHSCCRHAALHTVLAVLLSFPGGCSSLPRQSTPSAGASAVEQRLAPRRTELRQRWDEWGNQHLQDGDVIFILGSSRVFLGMLNFATFSTDVADSQFSHVGIIAIEDGRPYVYDTVSGGPRRKELGWYLSRKSIQRVAFRRPVQDAQANVPAAIAFCRQVYRDRVPYDEFLTWGEDKLYCSEFVDMAFRRQGAPLCDLTPIKDLPHFDALPGPIATLIKATTPLRPDQEVLFPGNDTYGIWSSRRLAPLLPPQPAAKVPSN